MNDKGNDDMIKQKSLDKKEILENEQGKLNRCKSENLLEVSVIKDTTTVENRIFRSPISTSYPNVYKFENVILNNEEETLNDSTIKNNERMHPLSVKKKLYVGPRMLATGLTVFDGANEISKDEDSSLISKKTILTTSDDFSTANAPKMFNNSPQMSDNYPSISSVDKSIVSTYVEKDQKITRPVKEGTSENAGQKSAGPIDDNSLNYLESLNLELPSSYEVEPVDFPRNPVFRKIDKSKDQSLDEVEEEDEDKSMYQAQLMSNGQDVRLVRDHKGVKKKVIPVGNDIFADSCCEESSLDGDHTSQDEADLDAYLNSADEFEDSIIEKLAEKVDPIPELTAEEERSELECWKSFDVGGIKKNIDLKVIKPYKKVLSHGGYLSNDRKTAIVVFSACYLPDRSRADYDYVMNNLFLFVIGTLDQLVTDDYILIYLHGATTRGCMPKFKWLKECYKMIDRKLRKNLKALYLVHPTFWLKTLVLMTKPFVSSKFSRKLFFVYSLNDLYKLVHLDEMYIPDKVKKYDAVRKILLSE